MTRRELGDLWEDHIDGVRVPWEPAKACMPCWRIVEYVDWTAVRRREHMCPVGKKFYDQYWEMYEQETGEPRPIY